MQFDYDKIILSPFTMKPNFSVYDDDELQNDISRYNALTINHHYNAAYHFEDNNDYHFERNIIDNIRKEELKDLGERIHFESDIAKENKLVSKISKRLNLKNKLIVNITDIGLAIPDDIIIMHKGRVEACFVPFASGWDPSTVAGKTLAEVHSPVADNEKLIKASDAIMKTITGEKCYHRYTWAISSLGTLSNHPHYERPEFDSIRQLTFRVEHEKTIPIVQDESVAFLLQIQTKPLIEVIRNTGNLLRKSINSMSDNVLEYKNLTKVKELINAEVCV